MIKPHPYFALLLLGMSHGQAGAVDVEGLLDLRAVHSDTVHSWTDGGLGKQRYGADHDGLRLGQAMLQLRGELADELTGTVVLNADDQRHGVADVTEAYLHWKPIPASAWQSRLKAGAFFPAISLENDGLGWTTTRTQSASAVNSWIGEELRTIGVEYTLARPGRLVQSPHDFSLSAALFQGNDPAGTLLTWRGWGVGDRISGLSEVLPLANLPIYGASGILKKQAPELNSFMEIDHRTGYYLGAQYGYAGRWSVSALHYDNRGDPFAVAGGQYAWATRFNHIGLRWQPDDDWTLLAQGLRGNTRMGRPGAQIGFAAWYVLANTRLGPGKLALRYDHFRSRENDLLPQDNNNEQGHGWTVNYRYAWSEAIELSGEWLRLRSERPARQQLGQAAQQGENSVSLALRWRY